MGGGGGCLGWMRQKVGTAGDWISPWCLSRKQESVSRDAGVTGWRHQQLPHRQDGGLLGLGICLCLHPVRYVAQDL